MNAVLRSGNANATSLISRTQTYFANSEHFPIVGFLEDAVARMEDAVARMENAVVKKSDEEGRP